MTCLNYTASNNASPLLQRKACTKNKLVYGVGVNDSTSVVYVNCKPTKAYSLWKSMLARCYASSYQKSKPTYAGCSVSKEWHSFSSFESWFIGHYSEGLSLDKDILFPGNKVYGPDTCVFVSQALNSLLLDSGHSRGECPLGVGFVKSRQKYVATVCAGAENKYLGIFTTPLEAHRAWQLAKADIIETFPTDNPRIKAALDLRAARLRDDYANGRITTKL